MKSLHIRGRCFGGPKTLVCVPLAGKTAQEITSEAKVLTRLQPDVIEWRADYFQNIVDIHQVVDTLAELRAILQDYPLIFTCRDSREGGCSTLDNEAKLAVIRAVIETGSVDLADIELISGEKQLRELIKVAHCHQTSVIVSYHDFAATPSADVMLAIFLAEQAVGADLAKIAVMPHTPFDVLQLLDAALRFRECGHIPAIAMSMSRLGTISRLAGPQFGSVLTFASHREETAPGQLPLMMLRSLLETMEK